MMIGHKPNYYWIVCWVALTPVSVAVCVAAIRTFLSHPFFVLISLIVVLCLILTV